MLKELLKHLEEQYKGNENARLAYAQGYFDCDDFIIFNYKINIGIPISCTLHIRMPNNSSISIFEKDIGWIFSVQDDKKIEDIDFSRIHHSANKSEFLELAKELKEFLTPNSIKFIKSLL